MKHLPTDISSFPTMITGNYVYVDKTEHIYNLFSGGTRLYFLSRPRRFGKSLLISTIKEFFSGNQALFKDLWISSSNYAWNTYPIIHLDFATIKHNNVQEFELSLLWHLKEIGNQYNIPLSTAPTINDHIVYLIKHLASINKVVILIDEYDKPILDNIANLEEAELMKKSVAGIYDVIKSLDEYIRATFITGVTKFAKTSIFSGMNNLNDISFDTRYCQLLGYTQEELDIYFSNHIHNLSQTKNVTTSDTLSTMKIWYNGYRFSKSTVKVYNPFSILYYLSKQERANYWFKSGTPTFLIHLIKQQYHELESFPTAELKPHHLESFELNNIPLIPLLFQTGYLTIADYNEKTDRITLNYPNLEVKESLIECIIASLANAIPSTVNSMASQIINALKECNLEQFGNNLLTLFSRIPYTLHGNKESYYHSLFQFLINLLIIETQSELLTHTGRIDTVIQVGHYIYIFELKINKTPQEALNQIIDKRYHDAYAIYKKSIVLVGLSFIKKKKNFTITYVSQIINAPL